MRSYHRVRRWRQIISLPPSPYRLLTAGTNVELLVAGLVLEPVTAVEETEVGAGGHRMADQSVVGRFVEGHAVQGRFSGKPPPTSGSASHRLN